MGEAVVGYEDDKKRGEWKMGVVEGLVIGRDGIVRGATVRVITKGKPVLLSRPVHLEIPPRNAALDSRCKSKIMLDS